MSTIKELRKATREKKYKSYVALAKGAYDSLRKLVEQEPDLYVSKIISHAIRDFADRGGYRQEEVAKKLANNKGYESVKETHARKVKEYVELYGGRCQDGTCSFIKYERTASGAIVKLEQAMGIQQLPADPDGIRKLVLGSFSTVTQAEHEYKLQQREVEEPKERIIKAKKKDV